MSEELFTLGKAQKGDILKLSKAGCRWAVIHKTTPHPQFNTVIQLRSENGTMRTYNSSQPKWKAQVWYYA